MDFLWFLIRLFMVQMIHRILLFQIKVRRAKYPYRAGHILDLYCAWLLNATLFCKNYIKLYFDAKHLEKGLITGGGGDFWCFFFTKVPFFSLQQHKNYKKENNKHYRLKVVFPQGTSSDIARYTAPEKK